MWKKFVRMSRCLVILGTINFRGRFLWVRRGCQASQRKGWPPWRSGEVRKTSGGSLGNFRGSSAQRAPGLKKFNLERRYWKNQAFNTEWNFQSRMVFSFWAPLWPQKNRAWDWNFQSRMKISNREWKFQSRMKISCVGEWFFSCVRARMNFFDPRALWVDCC